MSRANSGFKLNEGASPIFVAAMVVFRDHNEAVNTQHVIEASEARRIHKPEFKFSKCRNDVRDHFFQAVCNCNFFVRAIVVRKELIYSPRLKSDKDKFYEYFVKSMMSHDGGTLSNARVVIDGSGDREFRQTLNTAFRRKLGTGVVRDIRFKESHRDVLVQLADMCAGAIARSCRSDRETPYRWRQMLAPRIDNVWEFR